MAESKEVINSKGATIIALTPELSEYSAETADKNAVPFPILTDLNLKVADDYGLVFDLNIISELYENFAKLSEKNGEEAKSKLPITATYIIDKNGIVQYSFLNTDYRKRAEPSELIEALDHLLSIDTIGAK